MSWLTNLRGVVGTLFKIGKADFDSTAVTSSRTLALRDIAGTVALLSDITTYGRSLQEITPTSEGQTVFTVPGGYAVGSTDFLVNGVQLRTTEFTATDGTTVTISAGLSTTDLLTAIKWGNGGATSFTTTAASATAGQTAFTVPTYPTGLSVMAVYRNGIRLTPATDFVETNSTTVTLTSAADLNDDMLFISGTPVGSFGTMATQNASNVAITGGTINGTSVGATTASTGAFTTLSASGAINANGGQVVFPATQNPSSNVNTLDDYEEGTWSPVLSDGTNNATMDAQTAGRYTKIGNRVFISAYVIISSLGSVTGNLRITGLPFTVVNNNGGVGAGVAGYGVNLNITAGQSISFRTVPNTDYLFVEKWGDTQGVVAVSASQWTNTGGIMINFSYEPA